MVNIKELRKRYLIETQQITIASELDEIIVPFGLSKHKIAEYIDIINAQQEQQYV